MAVCGFKLTDIVTQQGISWNNLIFPVFLKLLRKLMDMHWTEQSAGNCSCVTITDQAKVLETQRKKKEEMTGLWGETMKIGKNKTKKNFI